MPRRGYEPAAPNLQLTTSAIAGSVGPAMSAPVEVRPLFTLVEDPPENTDTARAGLGHRRHRRPSSSAAVVDRRLVDPLRGTTIRTSDSAAPAPANGGSGLAATGGDIRAAIPAGLLAMVVGAGVALGGGGRRGTHRA
jgi:hypothetical protein